MASVLSKGCCVCGCCLICQFSVLGWRMSRNGIRSLVILLAVMIVIWLAVVIKILHDVGVFHG